MSLQAIGWDIHRKFSKVSLMQKVEGLSEASPANS